MLVDTHCHLNCLGSHSQSEIIARLTDKIVVIDSSIDSESSKLSLAISNNNLSVYSSLGFHPFSVKQYNDTTIPIFRKMCEDNKRVVAIGEIGLDEHADSTLLEQERVFEAFIRLAKAVGLPVVIHSRIAYDRVFKILDAHYKSYETVVFHCFSYTRSELSTILSKKGFVSFSLNIFRKKPTLLEALREIPLENLLLETDSPYMKIKDRSSTPLDIAGHYEFVAQQKNISQHALQETIYKNVVRTYPRIKTTNEKSSNS